jgi:hypothetical protein
VILDTMRPLSSTTSSGMDPGLADPTRTRALFSSSLSPCPDRRNRAEFMLEVIGAGATAVSTVDWHDVWKVSPEAAAVTREIHQIHDEGRKRSAVATKRHTEYSTSWIHQTRVVTQRSVNAMWRNPIYVNSKLILNIVAGLFIGCTFWKSPNTMQGVQNKLFSIFICLILTVPGAQQLQIPFIASRTIYEIRERPSKMYSWTAWVTSQILVELPLEHVRWCPALLLLVLDRGIPNGQGRLYLPHFHGLDPVILHDHRTGGCGYGTDARGRRPVVSSTFSLVLIL